ncbi:hypothetical protein [Kitasatospora griseola]|uniref:hypothetical protein n=1 Tax=Kitasatospora griseola TaxID=2064 RepID=UPI003807099B
MAQARRTRADLVGAVVFCGTAALPAGTLLWLIWQFTHLAPGLETAGRNAPRDGAIRLSGLLLLPVLVCAAVGAVSAGRDANRLRRLSRAGLGALIGHLLLVGALLAPIAVSALRS